MSGIPEQVSIWLQEHKFGEVTAKRQVSGGCIHHSRLLETSSGKTFFLKTNPQAPLNMFPAEARGLNALNVDQGPRTPAVYLVGDSFLLLEDLNPGSAAPDYWSCFGRQLASLHQHVQSDFGFESDNYIGETPQINDRHPDGYQFFAEQRLLYQGILAEKRDLLTSADLKKLEKLCSKLPDLIPRQPASLLHGDLWSGNIISDGYGQPAVIDPAVYYGWAEADLAMTDLFGSCPEAFYKAYQQVRPLEPGYKKRYPVYNLYHLLNHLNIFGGSYLSGVKRVLNKYT